jgi:hypothetical protein
MKPKNLIVSVPRLEAHRPPISVAIVAHAIELSGYPVEALDLNIKFFHYLADKKTYYGFDDVWDDNRIITLSEYKTVVKFLHKYKVHIQNCDQLLISVFGGSCQLFTKILCLFTRKYFPNVKIILGGQGVLSSSVGNSIHFGDQMHKDNLCDYYISGEGELAVVEFLKGNYNYPGINSAKYSQINELDELPFPNYKYFNISEYDWSDGETQELFVVGSRGCVRKCTYCDVARYWPKYRYRSGKNIADELIFHYEQTGINNFYFTDSLINGSLKSFRDMCYHLAKYNEAHQAGFKWKGQLIWRPKRHEPPEHFEMMRKAGADTFYVGVETGSDKIRWEMDKKFTNADIDYALEQFSKNGIKVMFLMLMGYLTETIDDHNETLKMFKRWQKYVADGTIVGIDLGVSLTFLKDSPVEKMIDTHDVYFYGNEIGNNPLDLNTKLWESAINPDLTVIERLRRRLETHQEAIKYNWPIWRGPQRLQSVKSVANSYLSVAKQHSGKPTQVEDIKGLKFIKVANI